MTPASPRNQDNLSETQAVLQACVSLRCWIGVGMAGLPATPPSEPYGRFSRIRLSSQWARRWAWTYRAWAASSAARPARTGTATCRLPQSTYSTFQTSRRQPPHDHRAPLHRLPIVVHAVAQKSVGFACTRQLAWSCGRITFVLLRAIRSPPPALHVASRLRSRVRIPGRRASAREGTSTPQMPYAAGRTGPGAEPPDVDTPPTARPPRLRSRERARRPRPPRREDRDDGCGPARGLRPR